ncbi:penicillin-binding protein [Vaginella massiliensis]|uniref:penicillin-binding protein n=1 Tax=Vaginella massiliensis TaxID=1816680 RepID=UPI0008380270|nr:penicillin-binding protein [Vaginella massiliensis]
MIKNRKSVVIRGWIFAAFLLFWAMAILFSMFKIKVVEGEVLDEFAKENNFRLVTAEAERGNLYASNGALLATTVTKHNIFVDLKTIKEELFETEIKNLADSLSKMFGQPAAEYEKKFRKERQKGNRYMKLVKGLDYEDYQRIKKFPIFNKGQNRGGFIHETENKRELIVRDVGARTIGFDDARGKTGLEGAYSELLRGREGKRMEQFMGRGNWKPFKNWEQEPIPGAAVYTTIDADLQMIAYDALHDQLSEFNAQHGCVVVMEVATGKVRAIVNLSRMEDGTYLDVFNHAVGEAAEPGSTFKPVSILAGMDDGYFNPETTVVVGNGSYKLYNRTITDSRGYGTLTVDGVIKKSSNIGTAKLINAAYGAEPEKFLKKLKDWKLDDKLGVDIPGEAMPRIITPKDETWSKLTLPVMSYGYGFRITPIQIVTFYNAIANNGKMLKPLFMDKVVKKGESEIVYEPEVLVEQLSTPENIKAMQQMLTGAVEQGGTASNIFTDKYSIAGKTGTARVEYWIKNQPMQYRASFAGYFPADKPKYSCVVIIHKPDRSKGYYGGRVTAPVFKRISDWVYSKTPQPMPAKIGENKIETQIVSNSKLDVDMRKNIVPNVVGYSGSEAVPLLENLGLDVRYTGIGKVMNQSLPKGTRFKKGETIYLVLK